MVLPSHSEESDYLLNNFRQREKYRTNIIENNPKYSIVISETRIHLKLSLYFLIRAGYQVYKKSNNTYFISKKSELLDRTLLSPKTKSISTILCGSNDPYTERVLFQLCIALSLSLEDSFDWFLYFGYNLNATTYKWKGYLHMLFLTQCSLKEKNSLEQCHKKIRLADDFAKRHFLERIITKKR